MGNMIEIREFTNFGIQKFESYLGQLHNSQNFDPPKLNDEPYSKTIESEKKI